MSLSEAPTVKITYNTAQDVSDEILGGVIQYCRATGYKQNTTMLTFFWSAFLLSIKETLDENGILNDTINCFIHSLGKVFPKASENVESRENINNMRQHLWNQLSTDFTSLHTEAEISTFIKIANELNIQGDTATTNKPKSDPAKTFSQFSSNISSSIYRILHDIDNGICIQYKYILDELRYARTNQEPKTNKLENSKKVYVNTPPAANAANGKPLGMAWYKLLIYFSLIASAVINIIYGFNYISGGIYLVETNGQVSAEQVYAYYGTGLQVVDVLYGFFLITFAILAFVVRHKLANYEPDSLKFVKILFSLSAGVPFLREILSSVIIEQPLTGHAVASAIVGLVFLLLNVKYFNKRAHLFVDKTISVQSSYQVQSQLQQIHKNDEVPIATKTAVTQQPTIKFCRKCGVKLHEDSTFCHKCGTKTALDI